MWKYKVVKYSRGGDGKWFAHRAAATFVHFDEARDYARKFHAEQQATLGMNDGHMYCVVPRRKDGARVAYPLRWSIQRVAAT